MHKPDWKCARWRSWNRGQKTELSNAPIPVCHKEEQIRKKRLLFPTLQTF
jgi:hypothetical protein